MTTSAHKTEGVNRTKIVRVYPFVSTGNDPRKGWRIPLNEIKYNEQRNVETCYGYCDDYQPHAAVDEKYFSYYVYDHSGGSCASREQSQACLSYAEMEQRRRSQRRLKLVGDNSSMDVCQRLRTPQNKLNEVSNADLMATYTVLNNPTLYPSAYMVLTNKGYTNVTEVESRASSLALPRCSNVTERKHYYAGTDLCASREQSQACLSYAETKQSVRSNRVAARLGGGGLDALQHVIAIDEDLQWRADKLFKQSLDQVNHRMLGENDLNCIMHNEFARDEFGKRIDGIPYQVRSDVETDYWQFKEMVNSMLYDRNQGHEKEVYFYHSDHLGSASWITDYRGKAVQHIQYLPYGEPYINQRPFGYSERFTFTGKDPRKGWRIPLNEIKYNEQRDALRLNPQSGGLCGARLTSPQDLLTGYGYLPRQARQAHHGARYMDHELMTMWLSVDPMSDKYPSISPYAYCAWNPVKLVDPDGREFGDFYGKSGQYLGNDGKNDGKVYVMRNGRDALCGTWDLFMAKVKVWLHSGNSEYFDEHPEIYNNFISILPLEMLAEAYGSIQDDGTHGISDANNREYGGYANAEGTAWEKLDVQSEVGNPQEGDIPIPGLKYNRIRFHSHPSGTRSTGNSNNVEFSGATFSEDKRVTHSWVQTPSKADIKRAGNTINYVFGMGDKTLSVYDKNGIQATIGLGGSDLGAKIGVRK